jgi:hypothetical protein
MCCPFGARLVSWAGLSRVGYQVRASSLAHPNHRSLSPLRGTSFTNQRSAPPDFVGVADIGGFRGVIPPGVCARGDGKAGVSPPNRDNPPRASAGLAGRPAVRELVGAVGDEAVLGADSGQHREFAGHLLPHPAQGDAEDPLAAREEVHDLIG